MSRCFFIATPGGEGAVAYHFMALGEALAAKGHRVIMLIDGQRKEKESHAGNPLIYTWPSRRPTKFRDAYFLFKLIGKFHPDCLIANFGAVNVMLLVGWLRRVRLRICWYHTLTGPIAIDSLLPPWQLNLLHFRKRWVFKLATHIVPVSRAALTDITSFFGVPLHKCRVIYNCLFDPLHHAQDKPPIDKYDLPPRLICVARFNPVKAHDILIRAAALLAREHRDFTLEFVGKGPTRQDCLKLVSELQLQDKCMFHGFIPHNEVLSRMAGAYASVLPSKGESFGYVIIESMALATPVVASGVGGIPEIIRDGVDGFLVPPGDPEALAGKLRELLTKPQLREKMGENARQRFLEKFERDKALNQQILWLESLLEEAPGP
jgi:glycosyltransferase involved in cell wall biosynthesis